MKKVLLSFLFLILFGCKIYIPNELNFKNQMDSLVGLKEAELIEKMATVPLSSYTTEDGRKFLSFINTRAVMYRRGGGYLRTCNLVFEVSKSYGTVISYKYSGNSCVA